MSALSVWMLPWLRFGSHVGICLGGLGALQGGGIRDTSKLGKGGT